MAAVDNPAGSGAVARSVIESRLRIGGDALGRLAVLVLSAMPGFLVPLLGSVLVGVAAVGAVGSTDLGVLVGFVLAVAALLALAAQFVRRHADWTRSQVERWYGVRISAARLARPALELDDRGHWWTGYSYHRAQGMASLVQTVQCALRDPAVRREMGWLLLNPAAVLCLAGPVFGLLVAGPTLALAPLGETRAARVVLLSTVLGIAMVALAVVLAPYAVRAHAELARRVLEGRASNAQLSRRVAELTVTRADAVDNQAAELRRIERDLHDGAQARLVAIGLTLGTIEHLMQTDADAARALLAEARQSSAKALQELRDLVRGIHPPVLAERGLADAVRELALDAVLPIEVTVDLPGRADAPVETALYFCVSELLANAAKHSGAGQVWVDILYRAGRLRVTVTDDGRGGAAAERGSGLRGVQRRLGTFDGVLLLDSPSGGPTTITMELPCELSSPRISTFSAKA
ncbi:sensor histidine kinase [Kitasatospora sp. NPDC088346]|uniref:sensor histidine kinase n=1 Tax=Kitasatospora sp. NPDC088346 TaxID=3364073 RepID=UPI0038166D73